MFDAIIKSGFDLFEWLGLHGKPKAVRKPDGYTKTTGPHGEVVDCDTLQCCHCGAHFEVIVGSGRLRGFCTRHMSYTCGHPNCMICMDKEQRLENLEAHKPELLVPTKVLFGELGPKITTPDLKVVHQAPTMPVDHGLDRLKQDAKDGWQGIGEISD